MSKKAVTRVVRKTVTVRTVGMLDLSKKAGPRWRCCNCGSTNVEVQRGVWFTETTYFDLTEVGDSEIGSPEYFWCRDCESQDQPEDLS